MATSRCLAGDPPGAAVALAVRAQLFHRSVRHQAKSSRVITQVRPRQGPISATFRIGTVPGKADSEVGRTRPEPVNREEPNGAQACTADSHRCRRKLDLTQDGNSDLLTKSQGHTSLHQKHPGNACRPCWALRRGRSAPMEWGGYGRKNSTERCVCQRFCLRPPPNQQRKHLTTQQTYCTINTQLVTSIPQHSTPLSDREHAGWLLEACGAHQRKGGNSRSSCCSRSTRL